MVLESTYGWYWVADVLQDLGAHVHLAHALGNNWGDRRVKNDERDARDLAAMLRIGRLAEGWIAPTEIRELRGARALPLLAHPAPHQRKGPDPRGHGKNGILPVVGEPWGPTGQAQLDRLELPEAYAMRLDSLRHLLDVYDHSIAELAASIDSAAQKRSWLSGPHEAPRGGPGPRRHLRGRDRRHQPLRLGQEVVQLGRSHPQAS